MKCEKCGKIEKTYLIFYAGRMYDFCEECHDKTSKKVRDMFDIKKEKNE